MSPTSWGGKKRPAHLVSVPGSLWFVTQWRLQAPGGVFHMVMNQRVDAVGETIVIDETKNGPFLLISTQS